MCVGTRLSLSFALLQESERYAYEWQRCLESALQVSVPPPPPADPSLPLQILPSSCRTCLTQSLRPTGRESVGISPGNYSF